MKQEILNELLGSVAFVPFLIALFYAFVGAAVSLLIASNARDVHSEGSPTQFSYRYLIRDNWKKIVLSVLLIFISIRFSQELLGQQVTMYLAFVIGLSVDRLAGLIKKIDNK